MKPSNTEKNEIYPFTLPDIGEGVVEGEVIEWLKNEGDSIVQDEPIVVIMTDKATVELPAPHPGVLHKQHYEPGDIATVGNPLYDILITSDITIKEKPQAKSKLVAEKNISPQQTHTPCGKALATPATRQLAKELNIDIASIQGSGKDGRVIASDLIKPRQHTPLLTLPDDTTVPLAGIPRLMALKMTEAAEKIPHFSYFESVDASPLIAARTHLRTGLKEKGLHLTYMPYIIRALSLTIKEFPLINSCVDIDNKKIYIHQQHNIGIAINSDMGLIVPVLHNVQNMSFEEIIEKYEELKVRALTHKLHKEELQQATTTISNFGVLGGEGRFATPIINYPEAAILATARIFKEPIVKNNEIIIRDTLNLSWSFDHRIIDGNQAASCSQFFANLIQNPEELY